ncbi:hypothetical protein BaRGS_00017189 [Batillaria attramentaria]|uniref:Uncharacterized protein n=1 Tax=Batillaria attramentaria TaxID=370345 RepID=A0ABD0KWW5_9CAEN
MQVIATGQRLTRWEQHCPEAFQEVKRGLTTAPVLGHPDFTYPMLRKQTPVCCLRTKMAPMIPEYTPNR